MTVARTKTTQRPRRQDKPAAPDPQELGSTAGATTHEPVVVDDLPDVVPVIGRELEVIEVYLGTLIDGLLAEARAASAARPIPIANPGQPIRAARPKS
jgi:hypothetical protein